VVASTRNRNQPKIWADFFQFLKTNWLFILGSIIAIPWVLRYVKKQNELGKLQTADIQSNSKIIENKDPVIQKSNADKITKVEHVQNNARDLAVHLGVKYSDSDNWWDFLDPRGWTENDNEVLRILKSEVHNIHLVKRLYYEVYTKSRNLADDVNKLLDEKQMTELKSHYKKYKKVW
jgi:hypothetical protein